jgi:hypothetical protein
MSRYAGSFKCSGRTSPNLTTASTRTLEPSHGWPNTRHVAYLSFFDASRPFRRLVMILQGDKEALKVLRPRNGPRVVAKISGTHSCACTQNGG